MHGLFLAGSAGVPRRAPKQVCAYPHAVQFWQEPPELTSTKRVLGKYLAMGGAKKS